jgi:hypothetical protein
MLVDAYDIQCCDLVFYVLADHLGPCFLLFAFCLLLFAILGLLLFAILAAHCRLLSLQEAVLAIYPSSV